MLFNPTLTGCLFRDVASDILWVPRESNPHHEFFRLTCSPVYTRDPKMLLRSFPTPGSAVLITLQGVNALAG